jgi:hypothetical protein
MTTADGLQALLEQLRIEEHAALGVDPDGTTYLDATDRIERIRAAYQARLAEEAADSDGAGNDNLRSLPVVAELR